MIFIDYSTDVIELAVFESGAVIVTVVKFLMAH